MTGFMRIEFAEKPSTLHVEGTVNHTFNSLEPLLKRSIRFPSRVGPLIDEFTESIEAKDREDSGVGTNKLSIESEGFSPSIRQALDWSVYETQS
jgi:hypothetical protein